MLMGAHIARLLVRTPSPTCYVLVLVLSFTVMSYADRDSDALLKFKDALTNNSALSSWNPSTSPCNADSTNWIGVLCNTGIIWGLQLEGMSLNGLINVDSLVSIRSLRTISLMNNNFEGPMPEIRKLSSLKSLYLSNNHLYGVIPDDAFQGMGNLKKVLLAHNAFTGQIPSSLAALPRLLELRLNGNQFQGSIPDFQQNDLKLIRFANNDLEGPIPERLSNMDPGSFAGNNHLCGPPLDPCISSSPSPSPSPSYINNFPGSNSPSKKNIPALKIITIALAIGLILAIVALAFFIFQWRKQKPLSSQASLAGGSGRLPAAYAEGEAHKVAEVAGQTRRGDQRKLSFVRDDIEKFDLQDMLRASAEVLGSGTFGASYKAVILSGQALVVKRYKLMNNVGREYFHEHMRSLGKLKHLNVLPVVAYYYRREEKLLVTEFIENSSLASHLHANHSLDQPGLHWITRLKIVKGIANGLAYLYSELPTLTIPHGHLKSSNVLLDESFEPLLTDYALRPVMNSEHAHTLMIAYKSPEYTQTGHISKKTDVWCFGILILELLTGKFPENYLTQGYDSNASLATWVSSMVKEKRTGEIFDKEMTGTKNSKGEMINLLKIGLSCCEEDVEGRMELKEVVEQIEQLKEGDYDEEYSLNTSEGNIMYTSGVIDGDFSLSQNR